MLRHFVTLPRDTTGKEKQVVLQVNSSAGKNKSKSEKLYNTSLSIWKESQLKILRLKFDDLKAMLYIMLKTINTYKQKNNIKAKIKCSYLRVLFHPLLFICHSNDNSLFEFNTLRGLCRRTAGPPRATRTSVVEINVRGAWLPVCIRGINSEGLQRWGRHCLDLRNNDLRLQGVFFEFTHALLSHSRTFLCLEGAFFSRC